jgi:murein DD-endopeptidase MepM/ murein hydrolase activator NlpD
VKLLLCLALLILPVQAVADNIVVYVSDDISRGQPMLVTIETQSKAAAFNITWQGNKITIPAECQNSICSADIILPTNYEKTGTFTIAASIDKKNTASQRVVYIRNKNYPVQRLTVDPRFVNLSKEDQTRAAKESAVVREVLRRFTKEQHWQLPLSLPSNGIVTSPFGVRRVFNDEPRGKHNGIDIAGATGDNVIAVSDGIVILTADHYFGGQSVFIDHGLGLISVYLHLSEIMVSKGDKVARGQLIGLVGATGRVTGAHLHFGIVTQGVAVDPMPLFKSDR